jgi:hypothetical protein
VFILKFGSEKMMKRLKTHTSVQHKEWKSRIYSVEGLLGTNLGPSVDKHLDDFVFMKSGMRSI